jgi:hypothetical protein
MEKAEADQSTLSNSDPQAQKDIVRNLKRENFGWDGSCEDDKFTFFSEELQGLKWTANF